VQWLGRWYIIKTFDKLDEYDVAEIRRILEEEQELQLIATKRLTIRPITTNDAKTFTKLFSDPDVMEFSDDGPRDAEWVNDWVEEQMRRYEASGIGHMAVVESDSRAVLGYCGLAKEEIEGRQETEIGYRLLRDSWGKGYATEAARAILNYAHAKGIKRVVATIDPSNEASLRVAKRLGMTYEKDVMMPGYTHPDQLYVSVAVDK
jgi:RimJ/RimL family protein N-acetyltransferase